MMKPSITLIIILLCCFNLSAQFEQFEDIEATTADGFWSNYFKDFFKLSSYIDVSQPYAVQGGINAETRFYNAQGIDPQQSPLYYFLSGNINARIYELDVPVSFLIATDRREFIKPQGSQLPDVREEISSRLTRIGASPTYKWATIHLGHRTMDFSPLTMSGLPYFGVGAELNPGNIRLAYFRGRLADAKPRDLSLLEPNLPIFNRSGYGAKIGYGTSENHIDFHTVRGVDDFTSIPITADFPITPNSNTVYGARGRTQLGRFSLQAEYAASATNLNTLDEIDGSFSFPFTLAENGRRPSSVTGNAVDAMLNYNAAAFVLGAQYKRISDGYQSVGIPFINSDIEEYAGNLGSSLLNGALQYNLTAGLQRDNLSGIKDQSIARFIYSINANYGKGPFNVGINYNNNEFSTDYLLSEDLDSLDVVAVTRNAGVNMNYNYIADSEFGHSFALAGNVSDIADDLDFSNAESTMYNGTFTYGLSTPAKWNFNATIGYNLTDAPQSKFSRILYGIGTRKSFLEDKLQFSAQANYFTIDITQQQGGFLNNNALNAIAQLSFRVNKTHSLYTRANLLRRADNLASSSARVTETIVNLGYNMTFNYAKTIKNKTGDQN